MYGITFHFRFIVIDKDKAEIYILYFNTKSSYISTFNLNVLTKQVKPVYYGPWRTLMLI